MKKQYLKYQSYQTHKNENILCRTTSVTKGQATICQNISNPRCSGYKLAKQFIDYDICDGGASGMIYITYSNFVIILTNVFSQQ